MKLYMIFLIFEILMILAYMINGYLGMLIALLMFSKIWLNQKYVFEKKIILSLILSVPIYNIGALGMNMHHIFSWYIIFLVIYILFLMIKLLKKEYTISKKGITISMIIFTLLVVALYMESNIKVAIPDFLQIFVMLISIFLTYQARGIFVEKIKTNDIDEFLDKINITIVAMSICTIIQCIIHKVTQNTIGFITVFEQGRTTYDLLFKGFSVLSVVLGIGILINVNKILLKRGKLSINIINIIMCISAIVINSSRTGLVSALIITVYMVLSNILRQYNVFKINKKQMLKIVILVTISMILLLGIFSVMQLSRNGENIFSDNGRIKTYVNSINIIFSNLKNFLIGGGISSANYSFILPHNFILETAMKLGIVFTGIIVYLILLLLIYIKNNKNIKYIIWHIFLSSMLITSFHEMSFIILYIAISIISTELLNYKNKI